MFSSTGIHPFDPIKAFNRIPSAAQNSSPTPLPAVFPQTPTTISTATTTQFPSQVLTSSPSDFSILQAANSTLNQIINNAEPLSTPVRKYIRSVTTAAEKLYTRTSILQERTEAQEALLRARQQRVLGKRSFIKGKFLLSTPEIYSGVVTSESNPQKNVKKRHKCNSI